MLRIISQYILHRMELWRFGCSVGNQTLWICSEFSITIYMCIYKQTIRKIHSTVDSICNYEILRFFCSLDLQLVGWTKIIHIFIFTFLLAFFGVGGRRSVNNPLLGTFVASVFVLCFVFYVRLFCMQNIKFCVTAQNRILFHYQTIKINGELGKPMEFLLCVICLLYG